MAIGKSFQVKFEDNSNKFNVELNHKRMKITYAVGLKWLEICTKIITNNGIVDTGRLRASLSFITPYKSSGENPFCPQVKDSKPTDRIRGKSGGDGEIIVGSNVKYASKQELTNKKGSFLKPSITEHKEDYKKITEMILKE